MNFSKFGQKFTRYAGITQLMDDLNDGLRTPGAIMLGGGNPANIPEMQQYFAERAQALLNNGDLIDALCNYDGPQGKQQFIHALADFFQNTYGWPITAKNIVLTNGSQSAFFYLFNLFAGSQADGRFKKVLLPLAPEYIGYADSGLEEDLFISYQPQITHLAEGQFKYSINFDQLKIDESIGLICVSRPTNPTGNVLTDEEIAKLDALAQAHGIPFAIDNAYGVPFPHIIFNQATPIWNDNTIVCMSLSKLGLPGVRCGIVIANEKVTTALLNMNGIISLAPGSVGPMLGFDMLRQGDLLKVSEKIILPFYQARVTEAVKIIRRYLPPSVCLIHKPEGAIFLWLWFQNLPITTEELYKRLKNRGVLMVPGHYFFPGLNTEWAHTHQCMRMNYVLAPELIERGVQILAEEIEKLSLE